MKAFALRTLEWAEKMNNPRAAALAYNFLGSVQYLTGEWDEALANLRKSVDFYSRLGASSGEASAWQKLGAVESAQGNLELAEEHLGLGLQVAEKATMRAHCLVRIYSDLIQNRLAAGDALGAVRYAAEGLEAQESHKSCVTCNVLFYHSVAARFLASGDVDRAEEYGYKAEEWALKYRSRAWIAMARQIRGLLHAAKGDWDAGVKSFAEAAEAFQAIGQPYDLAQTLYHWASLCLHRSGEGDRQRAKELLQRAQAVFQSLGAQQDLAKTGELLKKFSKVR